MVLLMAPCIRITHAQTPQSNQLAPVEYLHAKGGILAGNWSKSIKLSQDLGYFHGDSHGDSDLCLNSIS